MFTSARGLVVDFFSPPSGPAQNVDATTLAEDEADRRRKIIEGLLFSHWFILTYQAALCAVVLLFTLRHWGAKLVRWRARLSSRQEPAPTSSSSSSTLMGTSTPPETHKTHVPAGERTLLLGRSHVTRPTGFLRRSLRMVNAGATYQPPNIPIINKTLPSNSTSLLVLILLGLNIFYALYNVQISISHIFVFSLRVALLFVANLPWLYLLAAKNQPLKLLTGYSYENLNILHRRLGEWMCLLAVFHTVGMVMGWYQFFRPLGMTLYWFLTHRIVILGILGFICYEVLYLTSLASFRQWWYEVFLGTHIVLQAGGLVFLFFHFPSARVYTTLALAIFSADRLVYRLLLKTMTIRADLNITADGQTVLLSADWLVSRHRRNFFSWLLGQNARSGWTTTEHAFITVPALASKHVIQAHPFTIASAAPNQRQHAWFNLIIRAHNGFTRDLLRFAESHSSAMVRLDGPYGSLHALEMLRDSSIALLVVGGSGVAVAYPIIWDLLVNAETAIHAKRKVGLVWVIHETAHVEWLGHERIDELREMGLHVCIPPPTSKAGRPNVKALVHDMIQDMGSSVLEEEQIGIVVSGPDSMNRTARNACAGLAYAGLNISVAVEKYGW
jgi:NAD(P)H-flavin reductase